MTKLTPCTKLELRLTETMGWGVFATELIKLGEVVEDCWTIDIPEYEGIDILPTHRFHYPAGEVDYEFLTIPTGMATMYNHSNTPNVVWGNHPTIDYAFRFRAIRDIQMGEQCFIYYGNVEFP